MAGVSSLSGAANPVIRAPAFDSAKAKLDYDAFLQLFVSSMKNQDPTKPNDPAQTLAQLASFSNVEQSIKLNEKLDSLLVSSSATVAASLVGKTLSNLDGTISSVVKSVETGTGTLVAILSDDQRLNLTDGYRVSAA